jgi:hypothetical protein
VEILFQQQTKGSEGFNTAWTCQTETYDRHVMRRYEVDYFKEAFLGTYLGLSKDRPGLESNFDHLVEEASLAENRFFLHRDFQSRNIMITGKKIGILDWQGGRLGPLAYDLASLLIDPYTKLTGPEKEGIYNTYRELLRRKRPQVLATFERSFPYLAIQRNLQILGAFSFLSRVRGKTYFEDYIPAALQSLRRLLEEVKDENLSRLKNLVSSLPIQAAALDEHIELGAFRQLHVVFSRHDLDAIDEASRSIPSCRPSSCSPRIPPFRLYSAYPDPDSGLFNLLFHHSRGHGGHSWNGAHKTGHLKLDFFGPAFTNGVQAHKGEEDRSLHSQTPGINRQQERRINSVHRVSGTDKGRLFLRLCFLFHDFF